LLITEKEGPKLIDVDDLMNLNKEVDGKH